MKKELLEYLRDRFDFLYTKVGARIKIVDDKTASDVCRAYKLVLRDIESNASTKLQDSPSL